MCLGRLIYDSAVPSTMTSIEYGHSPQEEFSLDFEQPQGCVTLLLGVIFQNHATLSLHHCQAALPTASQGEDGA